MKQLKIILDTDIGDDIDDAFALAFVTDHPNINLLGVTTVFKNTKARAHQVSKYFDVINRQDVGIYEGEGTPLKEAIKLFDKDIVLEDGLVYPPQYDDTYQNYQYNKESAIDFIIESAYKYQGELILVPIGPLTNIALAINKDPKIKDYIKKIVLMGGWFSESHPEWNILCDPEAADIVFRSGIDVYAIGLDVTLQCRVEQDTLDIINQDETEKGKLLALWFKRWTDHFNFEKSVMHDPLAVATLISDVCVFEPKKVYVDLIETRGSIIHDDNKGTHINVATEVDREMFFNMFKQVIYKK